MLAMQPYQKGQVMDLLGSRGIQQSFDGQLRHIQVAFSLLLTHFAAQADTTAVLWTVQPLAYQLISMSTNLKMLNCFHARCHVVL